MYAFANLVAGTYSVRINAPYTLITAPANGTDAVTLVGGDQQTANFGIVQYQYCWLAPFTAPQTIYAPPTSTTDPNADDEAFIRGLYHSVLNRDAEPTGLAYWKMFSRW